MRNDPSDAPPLPLVGWGWGWGAPRLAFRACNAALPPSLSLPHEGGGKRPLQSPVACAEVAR